VKVLYYDCFAGISGDMNLGALIDLGVDLEYIKEELKKLNIEEEFSLDISKEVKQGIGGTKAKVILLNEEHHHHGDNEVAHNHHHRNYKEIKEIIDCSSLKDNVKELAIKIFDEVAKAEGKVHGKNSDEVHFHEVGATDSIVDIVSAAICIDFLKPDTIISSPIEVGCGMVKCAHGILPVPAPATTEILKDVPIIVSGNVDFEATTPTGAAILKTLCNDFNYEKNFTIKKVGYGLGEKEGKKIPNVLRVILAENKDLKKKSI